MAEINHFEIEQRVYKYSDFDIYQYVLPVVESNMYVLVSRDCREAIIIDPNPCGKLDDIFDDYKIDRVLVILTHEHFDHISGVNILREKYDVEVICSSKCAKNIENPGKNLARFMDVIFDIDVDKYNLDREYTCKADTTFEEEKHFQWNGTEISMIEAPGHSPGGVLVLFGKDILFTGDNLVNNGLGVVQRWPGGSAKDYTNITRPLIETFDKNITVFPGHGEKGQLGQLMQYLEFYTR